MRSRNEKCLSSFFPYKRGGLPPRQKKLQRLFQKKADRIFSLPIKTNENAASWLNFNRFERRVNYKFLQTF